MRPLNFLLTLAVLSSCATTEEPTTGRFRAEVWADNWFSFSLGETAVKEDSVPITTERSFNKERFGFDGDYPLVLNFVVKDFKEDDSGLEYIGEPNQQMGDGGFIVQLHDTTTGQLVAVTNASWRCLVIHRAPLDVSCEDDPNPAATCQSEITQEPAGWKSAAFDDSAWPAAVVWSAADVQPKEGYDEVTWDPTAKLVWSASLKQDNTLLCRLVVPAPG